MKNLIWAFLLFSFCASGQTPVLQKLWIGKDSTYLIAGNYTSAYNLLFYELSYKTWGTQNASSYFTMGKHDTVELKLSQASKGVKFLLDTSQKHRLVFLPLPLPVTADEDQIHQGKSVGYYTGNDYFFKGVTTGKPIIFLDATAIHTDTVKFEKIKFRQTRCYGICPQLTIEIDSKGRMQYVDQTDTIFRYETLGLPKERQYLITDEKRHNAMKQWMNYTAQLSKQQLRQLTDILKESDLDHLVGNHRHMTDGSMYTMEIQYNHKMLSFNTMMMPMITTRLMNWLTSLPSQVQLNKAATMPDIRFKEGANVADW